MKLASLLRTRTMASAICLTVVLLLLACTGKSDDATDSGLVANTPAAAPASTQEPTPVDTPDTEAPATDDDTSPAPTEPTPAPSEPIADRIANDQVPVDRIPVDRSPVDAGSLNARCKVDADCEIKDVGSCCGFYPRCLNKATQTFPERVKAQCGKEGRVSACGFPAITSCECVQGMCSGITISDDSQLVQ
jgi:hypothetical protein